MRPDNNNFASSLHRSPLQVLQEKTMKARQATDIFYATDPPEDESPGIEAPPPSLLDRLFPGVAPTTIWLGAGALGFVFLLKSMSAK
jgi:hypothetical protein